MAPGGSEGDPIALPARSGAELHLWTADLDAEGWPEPTQLPRAERERAGRLARPLSRRRWTAGRWALRGVLATYLGGEPGAIAIEAEAGGKPRLAGSNPALRFSLTHSHGLALVAVSGDREVGVDIEWIDPERDLEALARRMLTPHELEELRAAESDARPGIFYAAWTRREAIGKCLGVGLSRPPSSPAPVATAAIPVPAGFAGAVAVSGAELPPLRRFEIDASLTRAPAGPLSP